jgi:hypothetical protein
MEFCFVISEGPFIIDIFLHYQDVLSQLELQLINGGDGRRQRRWITMTMMLQGIR